MRLGMRVSKDQIHEQVEDLGYREADSVLVFDFSFPFIAWVLVPAC